MLRKSVSSGPRILSINSESRTSPGQLQYDVFGRLDTIVGISVPQSLRKKWDGNTGDQLPVTNPWDVPRYLADGCAYHWITYSKLSTPTSQHLICWCQISPPCSESVQLWGGRDIESSAAYSRIAETPSHAKVIDMRLIGVGIRLAHNTKPLPVSMAYSATRR